MKKEQKIQEMIDRCDWLENVLKKFKLELKKFLKQMKNE